MIEAFSSEHLAVLRIESYELRCECVTAKCKVTGVLMRIFQNVGCCLNNLVHDISSLCFIG